jgi:adenosylcobinamide-phosphate synthase
VFPAFGGPGPLLLLLAALLVDGVLGGLMTRLPPGPAALVVRLGADLDRRLNRVERGDTTRLVRGALVVMAIAVAALLSGELIHLASRLLPYGWGLEGLALLSCLRLGAPWQRIRSVRRALDHRGLEAARAEVQPLTRRTAGALDDHGVARAAVEAAAKHLSQGVVAPAFWYILLGLPGVMLWTAVDALDEAIGHRSPRYEHFGMTAARLDDALNFLPARLTGGLIVLSAAFLGSAAPFAALRTMIRDARYHRSLNAGWPEAAMAGALGLALGGPYHDGAMTVREMWIGQGRARATAADIGRALALHAVTCLVLAGLIGALMLALASL